MFLLCYYIFQVLIMDKINLKFNYKDYNYCYRVPDNFNWFQMYRTKRFTEKFSVYGKIFLEAYMSLDLPDIIDLSYRTEHQRKSMMNDFIRALIINKIDNDIIYTFAKKLDIKVDSVWSYNYSTNIKDFLFKTFEEMNNNYKIKDNTITDIENIFNNNPYNILGIEEKEYSNEDLSNIFNNKMNKLLDAYNTIKKKMIKN